MNEAYLGKERREASAREICLSWTSKTKLVSRRYGKKSMIAWYYKQNMLRVRDLRLDFDTRVLSLSPKLRSNDTACFPSDSILQTDCC
jgi:hypothetical protein